MCRDGGSFIFLNNSSVPIIYAKNVFAMINDTERNIRCLDTLLIILSVLYGAFSSIRWWLASPSIQYSILRKTISIKIVCGQTHPQNTLPNTTVNNTMKSMKVSIPIPKMKKSCGQKVTEKKTKRLSNILNRKKGAPFILTNGRVKNRTR